MFKKFLPVLLFWISWIALSAFWGHFSAMFRSPMSVHQGAQCDRASIALNFYQDGMDLFHPRVHEVRDTGGITGCEFPLVNYLAAICYQLFGFHEFWYRFLMWLVFSFGLFAFYRTLFLFYSGTGLNLLLTLGISASPVLQYYVPNFIPDTASLSFALMAWYFFFRIWTAGSMRGRFWLMLFLSLACMIKITSLISLILMAAWTIGAWLLPVWFEREKRFRPLPLLPIILLPAAFTWAWYAWAAHLNAVYGSPFFLLSSNPPSGWKAALSVFYEVMNNWGAAVYPWRFWIVIFTFIIISVSFRYLSIRFILLYLMLLTGIIGFMVLMLNQFRHHDYYFICLMILFFIGGILLVNAWGQMLPGFRILLVSALLVSLIYQIGYAGRFLKERYAEGSAWNHTTADPDTYREIGRRAVTSGADFRSRTIAVFDGAPNNVLYLSNLRGYRVNHDHTASYAEDILSRWNPQWMILNDTAFLSAHPDWKTRLELKTEYRGVRLYRFRQK